jgi:hypothetical protein
MRASLEDEKEKVGFAAATMENLPGHEGQAVREELCAGSSQT